MSAREARDAYRTYRSAYDIARHYRDEVVPLRKIISDETLLRYNAMLIDVFALLTEARQRIDVQQSGDRSAARFLARERRSRRRRHRRRRQPACAAAERQQRRLPLRRRSGSLRKDHDTCYPDARFIGTSAAVLASASAVSGRAQAAAHSGSADAPNTNTMQQPLMPSSGPDYQPVATLNGWTLPWRMNGDWKEFHLVAEPVVREFAPGMKAHLWGYNGQSPGPTIEAVEGDKVRIFVTNKLPEHTTIHWHGMLLPNGMDGVGGLTQPHIKPGKTFVYEFVLKKSGTFMYHPHADEMVQMAMGMMGFFVMHPRDPKFMRVDRDFVFLLSGLRHRARQLHAEGHRR